MSTYDIIGYQLSRCERTGRAAGQAQHQWAVQGPQAGPSSIRQGSARLPAGQAAALMNLAAAYAAVAVALGIPFRIRIPGQMQIQGQLQWPVALPRLQLSESMARVLQDRSPATQTRDTAWFIPASW